MSFDRVRFAMLVARAFVTQLVVDRRLDDVDLGRPRRDHEIDRRPPAGAIERSLLLDDLMVSPFGQVNRISPTSRSSIRRARSAASDTAGTRGSLPRAWRSRLACTSGS